MYVEFLVMYIGMGILALLLAAIIVLQCLILKALGKGGMKERREAPRNYTTGRAPGNVGGVVFCSNCATQYDAAHKICPKCGKAR